MVMIADTLATLRQAIAEATARFHRPEGCVQLLAVSKTRPATDILAAAQCGQQCFGENYVQEAVPKIQALQDQTLEWHFIGALQRNKTRLIAEHFDWVQSLDSLQHAQRLSIQRPVTLSPLNVCIQVNVSQEAQKSGVKLAEVVGLAQAVAELPRLRLRGLMALPIYSATFEQQRQPFRALYEVYTRLQASGLVLDTLSMGMTADMMAAIAEGATLVRVGTGIFGARQPKQ